MQSILSIQNLEGSGGVSLKNLKIDALRLHFRDFQSNTDKAGKLYNNGYIST